ncbi:MAG: integration host factor subunit alpha [Desulfobacteraceae bacterium]|nr:MAG: integration host factor subunit alpha [Desulfobacteraceae bacterium]
MTKALTKADIVKPIRNENRYSQKESADIIKSTLESGGDVLVSGFGKFQVKSKKARMGRNPATGDKLTLPPRRVVTFRCSGRLRDLFVY